MKCENKEREILWIEDGNNLMELSFKILLKNGSGRICISKNQRDLWKERTNSGKNPRTDITDQTCAVLFTKRFDNIDDEPGLVQINSKTRGVPLLLLSGPNEDMSVILKNLVGKYGCFRESVNFENFILKMREYPIYWASIETHKCQYIQNDRN